MASLQSYTDHALFMVVWGDATTLRVLPPRQTSPDSHLDILNDGRRLQMDRIFEIPDSTDWLNTSLSTIAPVEAALRCQVCKDFFDTPMITSCSHTFCSICIRRCLTTDGRCPTCRAGEQESKLRRNWTVQEVVDSFQGARVQLLKLAREAAANFNDGIGEGSKRKLSDTDHELNGSGRASQARKTRSQSRRNAKSEAEDRVVVIDDEKDGDRQPEDGMVPCPICNQRMKAEEVYSHLDTCDGQTIKKSKSGAFRSGSRHSPPSNTFEHSQLRQSTKLPPERLPKLNYSLTNDNALRKKMAALGIGTGGPKAVLSRRHTEWVNLWNANCDSSRPKSKRDLLQELDLWERSQGSSAPSASAQPHGGSLVMRKDFDGAGWAASHSDDFQQLIASARRKRNTPTTSDGETQSNTEDLPASVDASTPATPVHAAQSHVNDQPPLADFGTSGMLDIAVQSHTEDKPAPADASIEPIAQLYHHNDDNIT
ncbi:MAG: E3 ubiquitin-protein ligase rad18 [Pycnora praestabilis]|nr:MAG: E3 ubiquitin-protein ligase rad18 [Pycnora praestabilis]